MYKYIYTLQWTGFELTTLVVIWHDHNGLCPYQSTKDESIVDYLICLVNITKFACYAIFVCISWNAEFIYLFIWGLMAAIQRGIVELDHRLLLYTYIFIQNKIRIPHLKYCKYKLILISSMNKFKINKTVKSRRYHRIIMIHISKKNRQHIAKRKSTKGQTTICKRVLNNVHHGAMQYLCRWLLNSESNKTTALIYSMQYIYYLPVIFHILHIISMTYSM